MTETTLPSASGADLRRWFDLSADAMIAVDAEGRVALANAPAERMFGFAAGTLCGQMLEALVPERLRDLHRRHRHEYMVNPRARVMETEHELTGRRRDGTQFPIGISLSPIRTEQGVLVVTCVRDIGHTWRARQLMERARQDRIVLQIGRLAVESHDYEQAIHRIPERIAVALGAPTVVVFSTDWNASEPRIRAAAGLDERAAGILTATFGKARFIRNSFVPGGPEAITSETLREGRFTPIRAGLAEAGFQDIVMVPLFGSDEPLGALAALAPTPDAFGSDRIDFLQSVANLLAAAVQRSRSEEQLAHAQRLDAVGQLTGGVAHDVNNLLTVISGNLQLLEAELSVEPETRAIIDGALRAVERGAELTRRLLAFARRQPLRPRAIVPKPLLDELGHLLRRILGEVIEIDVECAANVPDVYADVNELDTALVNLALNARDAMPRGGKLRIGAHGITLASATNPWKLPPGSYVVFEVADTGTGMVAEVQAHACEPFFTTKGSGKGSGLGLSMVHGFVTQSGGAMALDSRLGYGTRVTFLLPVAKPEAREAAPADVSEDAPGARRGTILVVEDEADVRTIAARFLHAIGYEVLTADGAHAAIEILQSSTGIDLLFSDVALGDGMTGVELAREARRGRPGLAVLLTSGYVAPPSGPADSAEAADFRLLRKPYRREQLVDAVRATLGDH